MKQILFVVAMLSLATSGCARHRMMGCGEPACGVPCEPACGCCDPSCGDPCCNDGCCADGRCGLGQGNGNGNERGQVCSACGGAGCGACGGCGFIGALATGLCPHAGGYPEAQNFNPGPPTGQTAYPYYTTRGPRDFLQNNPPSIGPY
jgi:hypothetical protein